MRLNEASTPTSLSLSVKESFIKQRNHNKTTKAGCPPLPDALATAKMVFACHFSTWFALVLHVDTCGNKS